MLAIEQRASVRVNWRPPLDCLLAAISVFGPPSPFIWSGLAAALLMARQRAEGPDAGVRPRPPAQNHAISIEREVDVDCDPLQEDPAHSGDSRVARSDPWESGDRLERAIEIRRKGFDVLAVGHPPVALAEDVAACSGGEQKLSTLYVERSSRRTSSALMRRPASA